MRTVLLIAAVALLVVASPAAAQVCNIKVVTDANPDYSDMASMVHSMTAKWPTPKEKCWAAYYWAHIGRRQTSPMTLHGLELTDPIRQFNDYGFTMCSTVAGINCGTWNAMGLKIKFVDISNHTVSECFYDDRWHVYDDSMSALYTLCDGTTIASVDDVGKEGACAASGGKSEPGHIAKYHCLYATSARGSLTGADCIRNLDEEYRCFNPNGIKFRYYYNNWDWGHRYILNLREGESYTRTYRRGDLNSPNKVKQAAPEDANDYAADPAYYVPNNGRDPEFVNPRYGIRGNGRWTFAPMLDAASYKRFIVSESNIAPAPGGGLMCANPAQGAEVVFKIEGANVITGQKITTSSAGAVALDVSTTNGLSWQVLQEPALENEKGLRTYELVKEVNGAYEVLVKAKLAPAATLSSFSVETNTEINSKTQPKLLLGKNTVYVGAGEQTDSVVFWPDLQGDAWKPYAVDSANIATSKQHMGYQGCMFLAKPGEDGYVVFKVDAPRDITKVTFGGRLYNRAPKSHIDFLHSFDGGQTWTQDYTLTSVDPPWDVMQYVTLDRVPPGTKSVLFKYLMNSTEAATSACSIYAVRMEVNHKPVDPGFSARGGLDVTFTWYEAQPDRSSIQRSHTQLVPSLPFKYLVNVGGADQPVVTSLRVAPHVAANNVKYGYSDGKDAGGEKWTYRFVTVGKNFLEGKPYTLSAEPTGAWGGDDPDHKKLTDGIVGPNYAGGVAPMFGACFDEKQSPEITVDIGETKTCGAFRIHTCGGYPWWEAFKGEVKDEMEVLTSLDGKEYTSHGKFETNLWLKDIPINHMYPDDESSGGWNFELIPPKPVAARYVRFRVQPRRIVCVTEVQALDSITYKPFDMRIALPDER